MDNSSNEFIDTGCEYFEQRFSKNAYDDLFLVPIYTIVAVCYSVAIILSILRLLLWRKEWNFAKRFRDADRKMIAYMLESFFNMLHHREGILDMELEPETEVKGIKYSNAGENIENQNIEMKGKVADPTTTPHTNHSTEANHSTSSMIDTGEILRSKWAMTILSVYVANVTSLALVVFWDVFILKQTKGCNDEFECFLKNGTYIDSYCFGCGLTDAEQAEATCYEVALEFPMAIAEVAGILFLAFNGFTFLIFLKLLVADGIATPCFRITAYILLAVIEYSVVLAIIGAFVARGLFFNTEESTNTIIEEVLISLAMIIGVTTPWIMLLWALRRVVQKSSTVSQAH